MKIPCCHVVLEIFVVLGVALNLYTIHMEHQLEANRTDCDQPSDCKTCHKLPGKITAQCVDRECMGLSASGFTCKGKKNGTKIAAGGFCQGDKHYIKCPKYNLMCDIGTWSQCSKVFVSKWAHILVHWGFAEKGGALDFTLPQLGLAWFFLLFMYPILRAFCPNWIQNFGVNCYSLAGLGSLCFNGYLGWVLKTQIGEFCIVCFSTYVVNFSSVLCLWCDFRNSRKKLALEDGANGEAKKVQ